MKYKYSQIVKDKTEQEMNPTRGVAARGAMGDPTRACRHVQPRLPTQTRGQLLHLFIDADTTLELKI